MASAAAGHILLFWSPSIISEVNRVLLWIWLQKRGGLLNSALKREAFDVARRWFERMTAAFHVVEDRPPYAPAWSEVLTDENDRPIWTAANNAGVNVVVTANLKDGPPLDSDGIRSWGRVMYFHPDQIIDMLDALGDFYETWQTADAKPSVEEAADSVDDVADGLSADTRVFLRRVHQRARADLPDSAERG